MARITNADLDAVVENLNRRLAGRGSRYRVRWQRRYGYVALDVITAEGSVGNTLSAGRAGQVYEAAWHMIRGLDLLP